MSSQVSQSLFYGNSGLDSDPEAKDELIEE